MKLLTGAQLEMQKLIKLINDDPLYFAATTVSNGTMHGVIAKTFFDPKEFLLVYPGELALRADVAYRFDEIIDPQTVGSYIYCFKWGSSDMCYDATVSTGRLGRLVNHDHENHANAETVVREVHNCPFVFLRAKRKIVPGEELRYCYNDDKADPTVYPWIGGSAVRLPKPLSKPRHQAASGEMDANKV